MGSVELLTFTITPLWQMRGLFWEDDFFPIKKAWSEFDLLMAFCLNNLAVISLLISWPFLLKWTSGTTGFSSVNSISIGLFLPFQTPQYLLSKMDVASEWDVNSSSILFSSIVGSAFSWNVIVTSGSNRFKQIFSAINWSAIVKMSIIKNFNSNVLFWMLMCVCLSNNLQLGIVGHNKVLHIWILEFQVKHVWNILGDDVRYLASARVSRSMINSWPLTSQSMGIRAFLLWQWWD